MSLPLERPWAAAALSDAELAAVRRRAFGVAYRMLGSVADADDVAQEAMLRLARVDEPLDEPEAWVTTTSTRLSIDVLRLARVRRESYIGPWLPEPLIEQADAPWRAELEESVSQAFLVVLERLTPLERAAFLLRDVFGYDYEQIAGVLSRSQANCRQLVTRARRHVAGSRPRFDADERLRDRLLERFLAAADDGDVAGLETLLAEQAVLYSDGGGRASAARRPLLGARRIAHAVAAMAAVMRRRRRLDRHFAHVNGQPGVVLREPDGSAFSVLSIDVLDGRVQAVRIMRNPDKLTHV